MRRGIKAGREGPGKMQQCYFWPMHGDRDEICFPFSTTRAQAVVERTLGKRLADDTMLLMAMRRTKPVPRSPASDACAS